MKKRLKIFLWITILLGLISIISAGPINESLHINIQTTSSGAITTGTFVFGFNISTSPNCTSVGDVVFTNYSTLTTDSRGIISHYLDNVNLNFSDQYWLCYYRNGVLINSSRIARTPYTFRAKNVSAQGIINDSNIDLSGKNITSSIGFFNYLGNLLSRITTLFTQNINFNGTINGSGNINTTGNITTDWFNGKWNNSILYSHNTTANIGELYNSTASMISNLSINQLNWTYSLIANTSAGQYQAVTNSTINSINTTKNIQELLNSTGIYSTPLTINSTKNIQNLINGTNINFNNIFIGSADESHHIFFYEGAGFNENFSWSDALDAFIISDELRIDDDLIVGGYITTGGVIASSSDIYTTGSGDDFWIGNSVQNNAKAQINATGNARFENITSDWVRAVNLNVTGTSYLTEVGLGTSSPSALLHLYGVDARFRIQDDDDANSYFEIDDSSDTIVKIKKHTNSGIPIIDISPVADDGSSNAAVRFFRDTDTTGTKKIVFLKGDDSTTNHGQIGVDGENSFFQIGGGNFGIGTESPAVKLEVNGTSQFYNSIYQSSGLNILNYIIHKGRSNNFAGNNGLGQGAEVFNSWYNETDSWEKIYTYYGTWGDYQFSGGVFDGENIWMIPSYSDKIVKVNPATNEFTNYSFDDITYAYYGGCFDGRYVWMAPAAAENISKIDILDGSVTTIAYDETYNHGDGVKFSGCVFTGEEIWFIPEENDYVVYADPEDDSLTVQTSVNISAVYGDIAFNGGVWDGEKIWMVPYQSSKIVSIDPDTFTLTNYTHGSAYNTYVGGCWDGQRIWLSPANSLTVDFLNPKTGEFTKYSYDRELILGTAAFTGCAFDGTSVWFAPTSSEYGMKMNPNTGEYEKYYFNGEDGGYRGVVFDGESVWFIPFQAQNITKIRPPEFGKDSLYTSGNLNVGGVIKATGKNRSDSGNFNTNEDNSDIIIGEDRGGGASEGNIKIGNYQVFVSSDEETIRDENWANETLVIQAEDNPTAQSHYQLFSVQSSGDANRFAVIHGTAGYGNQFRDSLIVGGNGNLDCSDAGATIIDCGTSGDGDLFVADDAEIGDNLYVAGDIYAAGGNNMSVPDFVFEKNYNLISLEEIKNYVNENKHLPYIRSAEEIESSGFNLVKDSNNMLEAVENLFLHLFGIDERIQELKSENEMMKQDLCSLGIKRWC